MKEDQMNGQIIKNSNKKLSLMNHADDDVVQFDTPTQNVVESLILPWQNKTVKNINGPKSKLSNDVDEELKVEPDGDQRAQFKIQPKKKEDTNFQKYEIHKKTSSFGVQNDKKEQTGKVSTQCLPESLMVRQKKVTRKPPTKKTEEQVAILEQEFQNNPCLWSKKKIVLLSNSINLKVSQIYKWNYD